MGPHLCVGGPGGPIRPGGRAGIIFQMKNVFFYRAGTTLEVMSKMALVSKISFVKQHCSAKRSVQNRGVSKMGGFQMFLVEKRRAKNWTRPFCTRCPKLGVLD